MVAARSRQRSGRVSYPRRISDKAAGAVHSLRQVEENSIDGLTAADELWISNRRKWYFMSPTETIVASTETHTPVCKKAITEPRVLNEAYEYAKPSSFSRGLRLDIKGVTILMISGTASIDEHGKTVHVGDFRAQMARTLHNITGLLAAEGATWKDVVRTTCYLRDIERDYDEFNQVRTQFFKERGLDPLPASTGIQAILCRPDLLIEIEAIAMFESDRGSK